MSLILAYQDKGITKDLTILDGDGDAIVPGENDLIRVIIGREGKLGVALADAELVVTSGSPTANGSSLTKNSPSDGTHRLRLDASDLDFPAGIYSLLFELFDNADAQEWKAIDRETFSLQET